MSRVGRTEWLLEVPNILTRLSFFNFFLLSGRARIQQSSGSHSRVRNNEYVQKEEQHIRYRSVDWQNGRKFVPRMPPISHNRA